MKRRQRLTARAKHVFCALVGFTAAWSCSAATLDYPVKSIRIVSPFAAGGTNDYLSRLVGRVLTEAWGQSVVVENRPGAGGNVGSEVVARALGDGYTLLMGSVTTHAINPALYEKLPFNAQRDFAPVTGVAATQTVLVVHPSVPVRSVKDLIALARSRPKALNFGSAGHGSISHMAVELLTYTTGAQFTHVPYKGEGQAAVDLMAGGLDFMFPNMPTVLGLVHAGKLRAIAVGGAARSSLLPDVPTMGEAGAPGYEMTGWFGMFSPAGTSREILTRLNIEVGRGLQRNDIRELLAAQGAEPVPGAVDEFGAFVRSELGKWAKVVAAAGVKVD